MTKEGLEEVFRHLELLLVTGEVGRFDVEPVLTGKAEHILAVDVPRHAVGMGFLQGFQEIKRCYGTMKINRIVNNLKIGLGRDRSGRDEEANAENLENL